MTGPETPVAEESVEQPAIAADASVSRAPWRRSGSLPSLPEAYRSIPIQTGAPVWRKLLAFAGPGYLVAVGYMDPGNWATDLGGGSKFGYTLLSVILLSNLMAMYSISRLRRISRLGRKPRAASSHSGRAKKIS